MHNFLSYVFDADKLSQGGAVFEEWCKIFDQECVPLSLFAP